MLRRRDLLASMILCIALSLTGAVSASGYTAGRVFDYSTLKPIEGAVVTGSNEVVLTDGNGMFMLENPCTTIGIRACGFARGEQRLPSSPIRQPVNVYLLPFTPKALYMTSYGIGDRGLRESALNLLKDTELNSLVIDVKGDRGIITYRSSIPLASEIGAQKPILVKDMGGLVRSLKGKGIYTIARIVVFKDTLLGAARPELAVRTPSGGIFHDKENLVWVDPSRREVWDYNIDIAIEAARQGFDEVQFDYVRFPDKKGLQFAVPNTEENRVKYISGFLSEARRRLAPYNVFVSADIFGYVSWNLNDTLIGQKIEKLATCVDYLSLMLYPSGFQFGIPGYRNPVAHPGEIVSLSLKRARERTGISSLRFRPWLQAFRDYAFDRRHFYGPEIRDQVNAAEAFGAGGWMLWNPRNVYTDAGLKRQIPPKKYAGIEGPKG